MYTITSPNQDSAFLKESVLDILGQTKLLSMATASSNSEPWINTAYFSYDDTLTLFIITYPNSKHIKNLNENNQLAINIFDTGQNGDKKQGLQLAGMCSIVPNNQIEHALNIWGSRILGQDKLDQLLIDSKSWESKPYKIVIDYIKIFDEKRFGIETWIECLVER